jgi:hypothetical protein
MLKDSALDHYNTNLASFNPTATVDGVTHNRTFEEITLATRNYFETPEYRRSQQQRFNELTLTRVVKDPKNAEKPLIDCLIILVQELRTIQSTLDPNFRNDHVLLNQLVTACRGHPACRMACFKPADTVPKMVNDLQSSIVTYNTSIVTARPEAFYQSDDEEDDPEAYYTNRQYHRSDSRPPYRGRSSFRGNRFNRTPRFSRNNRSKTCFVCHKPGCWSNKHTDKEREESKARFKARFGAKFDKYAA